MNLAVRSAGRILGYNLRIKNSRRMWFRKENSKPLAFTALKL